MRERLGKKCRLCGGELVRTVYKDDIQGAYQTVEENIECDNPNCDYFDGDSYGQYFVTVNGRYWSWHWNIGWMMRKRILQEIEDAIVRANGYYGWKHRAMRYFNFHTRDNTRYMNIPF